MKIFKRFSLSLHWITNYHQYGYTSKQKTSTALNFKLLSSILHSSKGKLLPGWDRTLNLF
ncbi:hypothetical protein FHX64_001485 [Microbacter margulisiae]|uniref:Uncharacterized protein n=1 Tax=Microbacter margulisiae TaxID=1350067 RepID=A0A7W5H2D7_9PORP|nr:hypothetical protein [Microbacter margulisiae]